MKICGMSDLHGDLPENIEECELVCICGDISPLKIQANHKKMRKWMKEVFKPWCETLPCDKVLFIAGNHDHSFQNLDFMYTQFPKDEKTTYLFHENYVYTSREGKEYSIFGTPYCKIFGNWAFMEIDEILAKYYSQIPEGLDILLSHDQPYGFGDILLQKTYWNTGEHIGNKELTKAVLEKQPHIFLSGHLHSTTHECVNIKDTKRYNVSLKDEFYNMIYEPTYIEL